MIRSGVFYGRNYRYSIQKGRKTSGGHLFCADRSGTETQQPDAAGSVLWGLGNFPNKHGFRVTKAMLAEE